MLEVQKFLQKQNGDLALLKQYYGINAVKHPTDSRVILNYDQIDSSKHKFEPIVRECRALTLDSRDWSLVARGFYRFFNWGEYPAEMKKFDFERSRATFKEDGSYINVYNWGGRWHVQTRGSFGDGLVNDFITWRHLFELASPENLFKSLDTKCTYVFELCSLYNQVVRRYDVPSLFLLTVFDGYTEYVHDTVNVIGEEINVHMPTTMMFRDIMDVEKYLMERERVDKTFEGFVLRDNNNYRFKHKSSTYVALHRLAGNGNIASEKSLIKFVLAGERDELVTYFPYVAATYDKLATQVEKLSKDLENYWYCFKDEKSRKKFALAVQKCPMNSLLFIAKDKYDDGETDVDPVLLMRASPEKVTKYLIK